MHNYPLGFFMVIYMYDRLIKLIGEENLNKLQNTRVLLVGVGGVGGMALECLARSGIGHITIVDGDTYEESNLNRQIGSSSSNIGNYKVDEEVTRIKNINIEKIKKYINQIVLI